MTPYVLARQSTPEATLYNCFKKVQSQGLRCLYLDKMGHGPIRKINLFYVPIYANTKALPLTEYNLSVSFIPKSELNNECYLLEFIESINGKFIVRSPEKFGCTNMIELFEEFLYITNIETGCLKTLQNNTSNLENQSFAWFVDFLNNGLRVRHLGNDSNGHWRYEITKEEEEYYKDAFKKLFRKRLVSKDLNLRYALNLKSQYFDSNSSNSSQQQNKGPLIF